MAKRKQEIRQNQHAERRSSGLVVALLALIFLSFMASQWKERQRIADIHVVGATGLSRIAIQRVVDTLRYRKTKAITLASVRQAVEGIPYVRSASVYFTGVRDVCVDVSERLPVAHVVRQDGVLRYVDEMGSVLPVAQERTAHNVPLIHASGGAVLSSQDIVDLVNVLNQACGTLDPRLYQSISEIRLDPRTRSVDVVTDEATWRLGRLNVKQTTDALADMNIFWKDASMSLRLASVEEVDLRWRHQVVLRYRKDIEQASTQGASV
ncbi:MAG: FtsQ-type POTRA domain-containing protein [Candidatus Kapabacteria bacterium]|nr:FtsQ-type POTRA domain-containing protein [Candidatus Kapabacteria bacterium]